MRLAPILGAMLLALLPSGCATEPQEATAQTRVLGYHAWWMQDTWKQYDLALYDKVFFFEFAVEADGSIGETHGWPEAWRPMIEAAHEAGARVAPTFAILDPAIFSSVLGNPDNRGRLESTILSMVKAAGADGVHLNFEIFEPPAPEARAGYSALARNLRAALRQWRPDAELTLFLPGFDYGESYDEVDLARSADYLVVQGYDMHWLTSPDAGPVAPIDGWSGASWTGILARYADLGIPRSQIVMTVPYFGYEWPTVSSNLGAATRGEGVPITYSSVSADLLPLIRINAVEQAATYGLNRDPVSGSPYYTYRGSDGWYQGWFEDEASLRSKYQLVRRQELGGVAVFLLGYDGGRLEAALRDELRR